MKEQDVIDGYTDITTYNRIEQQLSPSTKSDVNNIPDQVNIAKLYAIKEAIADRVAMHKNVGEQRSQWNNMLLTSINVITLAAATMTAIAATSTVVTGQVFGLKISSTLLYLAATIMLVIMNKIQPSQLAEEQRIAARLFQNLLHQIDTTLSIGHPMTSDVQEAMDNILTLDKAYPLPILGVMLDKLPSSVEPSVWWPQPRRRQVKKINQNINDWNGWNAKLEEEMREIMGILGEKDQEEYIRLGKKALKLNKFLAICGPLLTGLGAIGSALVGFYPSHIGSWAAVVGTVAGALATIVNTIQHGGQVGMVFEMYRNNAGFFKYMKENIEFNLMEKDVERRENGEVFELKVALMLGRSLLEVRNIANASSWKGEQLDEFASKLF